MEHEAAMLLWGMKANITFWAWENDVETSFAEDELAMLFYATNDTGREAA